MNNNFSDAIDILRNNGDILNLDKKKYTLLIIGEIQKFLNNYTNYKFRTVPGVMNQVVLYKDDKLELRVHDFINNVSDTYIHNHKNPFISYCLYGGYEENIFNIKKNNLSNIYEFERKEGGEVIFQKKLENYSLILSEVRKHFEGNFLITNSEILHSIIGYDGNKAPITFIIKFLRPKNDYYKGLVYNDKLIIENPIIPIRKSNIYEINHLKTRLNKSLLNIINN